MHICCLFTNTYFQKILTQNWPQHIITSQVRHMQIPNQI